MVLAQPVTQARGQQQLLITITRKKVLRHHPPPTAGYTTIVLNPPDDTTRFTRQPRNSRFCDQSTRSLARGDLAQPIGFRRELHADRSPMCVRAGGHMWFHRSLCGQLHSYADDKCDECDGDQKARRARAVAHPPPRTLVGVALTRRRAARRARSAPLTPGRARRVDRPRGSPARRSHEIVATVTVCPPRAAVLGGTRPRLRRARRRP